MTKKFLHPPASLCLIIIFISLWVASAQAQVGINNPNPDASAILDLKATNKGLLIPRLTSAQRQSMTSSVTPAKSLLVFDTTEGIFYFFNAGVWYALNELVRKAGSHDATLPSGNLTVEGQVKAASLSVTGFPNNALVPAGVIVMWSGTISTIPSGWALCNGSNNTPDLRARFIVGAGSTYAVSNKGGNASFTLNDAYMPDHTHTITSSNWNHSHSITYKDSYFFDDYTPEDQTIDGLEILSGSGYRGSNSSAINKNYISYMNRTASTSTTTGLSPTITASTAGRTSPTPVPTLPPYYALAYIMKLP